MDNILNLIEIKLKELNWIKEIHKSFNTLKIQTSQGIEYYCRFNIENNCQIYVLENDYFKKRCKIGEITLNSKYFDSMIIPDIVEENLFINDMFLRAFKNGIEFYKTKNDIYELKFFFEENVYHKYRNDRKILFCICDLWKEGKRFASQYPLPDIVQKQYEILREKTLENVTIEKIREFMKANKEIHIYLDEKKIPENARELQDFKEIEYSYGHIVAKANTYDIKMNLLPLNGEIIVFDNEGINELASCNVADYKRIYEEKIIEEMFKIYNSFAKDNYIRRENKENEQEE